MLCGRQTGVCGEEEDRERRGPIAGPLRIQTANATFSCVFPIKTPGTMWLSLLAEAGGSDMVPQAAVRICFVLGMTQRAENDPNGEKMGNHKKNQTNCSWQPH